MNIVKRVNRSLLPLAAALAIACNAGAATDVLATVNGKPIPRGRLDYLLKTSAAQGHPETAEMRQQGRDMLISQEALYQEAVKKGYDRNPDVATQVAISREEVVINAYLRDYIKNNPVSDEAVKRAYEQQKALSEDREYRLRHILVRTEDEAKQIVAQLKKGTGFEKLAAEKSDDPGSKSRGGDLGWAALGRYVPQFGDAVKKMKKGQVSETPVHTQFGWHVIRVDDERPLQFPTFEQAKGQILQTLQRQSVEKVVAELRAKAKIE